MKYKVSLLFFLLFLLCSPVYAQSVLGDMPYGIIIGKTKSDIIESKGVCTKQIKVRDNYFRCSMYNVSNKFTVFLSQDETVSKISFEVSEGNKLPKSWRSLGLTLGIKGSSAGTSLDQFKAILTKENIKYDVQEHDLWGEQVSFEYGDLEYVAVFADKDEEVTITKPGESSGDTFIVYKGIYRISITESY